MRVQTLVPVLQIEKSRLDHPKIPRFARSLRQTLNPISASQGRPIFRGALKATRLAREDLPDLVQLHLDGEVSRFLGGVRTPTQTATYLETSLRHWADHGLGLWTLRTDDGAFVGRAGLRHVELEGVPELEVAYTFVRSAWRQGFATEIAKALVELWEKRCVEPSLVGIVMKGNLSSERVLLKAGFSYERDAIFHDVQCSVFRRGR